MKQILNKEQLQNIKIEIVDRLDPINDQLQTEIDTEWEKFLIECKERNIKVWNGKQFRFEGYEFGNDISTIKLSVSDYKTAVMLSRLDKYNIRNNMVVISLVITSDNYLVLAKRKKVGTYSGIIGYIAGGMEPIKDSQDLIFDNMKVELQEELGLSDLEYKLKLNDFMYFDQVGIYAFVFITNTSLTKDEHIIRFKKEVGVEENSELVFFENNKKGVANLMATKDVFESLAGYTKKFYELEYLK